MALNCPVEELKGAEVGQRVSVLRQGTTVITKELEVLSVTPTQVRVRAVLDFERIVDLDRETGLEIAA